VVATVAMTLAVLAFRAAVAAAAPFPRLLASVSLGTAVYAAVIWLALGRRWPRALLTAPPRHLASPTLADHPPP
jgi:hypothetical protein